MPRRLAYIAPGRDGHGVLPGGSLVSLRLGSRWARRLARRLARIASADGLTHARRRARRLAYIVSARDGPGGLPDSSCDDCLTGKIR